MSNFKATARQQALPIVINLKLLKLLIIIKCDQILSEHKTRRTVQEMRILM